MCQLKVYPFTSFRIYLFNFIWLLQFQWWQWFHQCQQHLRIGTFSPQATLPEKNSSIKYTLSRTYRKGLQWHSRFHPKNTAIMGASKLTLIKGPLSKKEERASVSEGWIITHYRPNTRDTMVGYARAVKDTLVQQNDPRNTAALWYLQIIMVTVKVNIIPFILWFNTVLTFQYILLVLFSATFSRKLYPPGPKCELRELHLAAVEAPRLLITGRDKAGGTDYVTTTVQAIPKLMARRLAVMHQS